ncbi:MAG: cytochrome c-550 PedF [Paracoccaceae bacterium]
MKTTRMLIARGAMAALVCIGGTAAFGHGDVAPQPVNTEALPDIGEEWLIENPYRGMDAEIYSKAIDIGSSGYNQNCARCHGLGVISGGLAPDLRFLEAEEYGDEWFAERFRFGYTQNGTTKMPAFADILGQKAGWAIRTYIETRPDSDMIETFSEELHGIRDQLAAWGEAGETVPEAAATLARLEAISGEIDTLSGAELADSIAYRAYRQITDDPASYTRAAETLTIGLSVAE